MHSDLRAAQTLVFTETYRSLHLAYTIYIGRYYYQTKTLHRTSPEQT